MKRAVLDRVPAAAGEWVGELLAGADATTLERFLFWHGETSLATLFAWTPPWPPPRWSAFIQHCLPDWMPADPRLNTYLSSEEVRRLRRTAIEVGGAEEPLTTAYRIFAWVHQQIRWSAAWGTALPSEVIARSAGGSFHLAQLCVMLLRSVFLPARLVEEVAFAPAPWREAARALWQEAPAAACKWFGRRAIYHPSCEVLIGARWLPLDPQRGQFGRSEITQHLRCPELLKLAVRSWQDYGRLLSRTGRYTLRPLAAGGGPAAADLRRDLATVARILRPHFGRSVPRLDDRGELLDRVRETAGRLWRGRRRGPGFSVESPPGLAPAVELYLQAAVPEPLGVISGDAPPPAAGETRILLRDAVGRALDPAYRRAVDRGAHLLLLFEVWGQGEEHLRKVLAGWGGSLGAWVVAPDSDVSLLAVESRGSLAQGWRASSLLDLRPLRSLRGLPPGTGTIAAAGGEAGAPSVLCWRTRQGRGTVTLAPITLAARADPYAVDYAAGCHRRALMKLLGGWPAKGG